MAKKFLDEYILNRDECLEDIKEESVNWNKFVNYWARHLDKYTVDNILTLYSYNPSGTIFYTFDEWNSDLIDRRIKPKSKGVPILTNDYKTYVFDIRQTYGKDYKDWRYYHNIDKEVVDFYQNKYNLENNERNIRDKLFFIFHEINSREIKENSIS